MGYIYRIFDNNISYIGQTTRSVEERISEHIYEASRGVKNNKLCTWLRNNINKFEYETICECPDNQLDSIEAYYINKYNSYHMGLNSNNGGSGKRSIDYTESNTIIKNIITDYTSNMSISNLVIKYNISEAYLYKILRINKVKRSGVSKTENISNKNKAIYIYDTKFNFILKFESISHLLKYLESKGIRADYRNYYRRIKEAAKLGKLFKGYRWQYEDDLIYDNMTFNSIFDKEAYKNGGSITKNEHGLIECTNEFVNTCRNIKQYKCIICGKLITKGSKYCWQCYNKKRNAISYRDRQVPEGTVITYPFVKEELQGLYPKYTMRSIANYIGVSDKTVDKWLKKFKLK